MAKKNKDNAKNSPTEKSSLSKSTEDNSIVTGDDGSDSGNAGNGDANNDSDIGGDSRVGKVSLPVGGGAIRSIGEKFEANPVTGTTSFSVPLAMSEGRGGFTPQLALNYDSGSGNSAFGLGWNIGLPSITRKTDKGLPQYNDNPNRESDVFILSGAEDLVPLLHANGSRQYREEDNYDIYAYRPRVEGLFARIERWVDKTTKISHWRSISKDNIISIYGYSASARVADPDNERKIFSWMLEESQDAKGNDMLFVYQQEDSENVPKSCYERPRLQKGQFANIYLKQVLYGNMAQNAETKQWKTLTEDDYLFKLEFDYGMENGHWTCRQDPFSNYRAGFEIRTYRLCHKIEMYHQFTELGQDWTLTKATELIYDQERAFTLLKEVKHTGYQDTESDNLPPLTFNYTEAKPAESFKTVSEDNLRNLPSGVDGQNYQWADLYSEGVSGIIAMKNEAWYFMPNYGDKRYAHPDIEKSEPSFGGMKKEINKPAAVNNNAATFQLGDVNSDGLPELIIQGKALHGFYSRDVNEQWLNFRNFSNYPNINTGDTNLRFMDLSGDGLADIVISKGETFDIYFSEGKQGYGNYRRVSCGSEAGFAPRILFSDAKQRIFLADMSGDGLTDIVRVTPQSVVYYPNMGYGKFGKEIVMSAPPLMDSADQWEARHVFLADVDGTGTSDLLYISKGKIKYWKNLSGNTWEEVTDLAPAIVCTYTQQTHIQLTDLLGNGTQCLVVSSSLPAQSKTMRYWELTDGIKPFLLNEIDNNMGGITRMQYAASTKFYIQDKFSSKPWITRLPFPVHVLEKVEITDLIAETKFTSRYAYHHGYYDHAEREFRGFGMVEQWDAELFDAAANNNNKNNAPLLSPPVYTKTWFHTGFFRGRDRISRLYAEEYYQGDTQAWLLPDTILPEGLNGEESREACRALKGSPLRIEIYAQDGSDKESIPYTVEEKNYQLQCLQHKQEKTHHAVFLKTDSETLNYYYERNADDPRTAHALTLESDEYGNPTKQAQIAYPRRTSSGLPEQDTLLATYTENSFINHEETENEDFRWIGIPYKTQQYQIHNLPDDGHKIEAQTLLSLLQNVPHIDYAATPSTSVLQLRLIADARTYFWNEAVTSALSLGEIASHSLTHHSETLELTQDLINVFNADGEKITDIILTNEGCYTNEDDYWFKPTEIQHFDPLAFYLPDLITDPFGNQTAIEYDNYNLFPVKITDALGFETTAEYDYLVLQPYLLTDPNGNSQAVAFDPLGMVTAMAVMGKNGEGDTLEYPTESYEYYLHEWENSVPGSLQPDYVHIKKREKHGADPSNRWIESHVYTNGLGKDLMTKTTCADGNTWEDIPTTHRWLASGKTILDNKGNPVMQYEPWFSDNPDFEYEAHGVTPIMHYDPIGRLIQTDFPDDTTARVEFDVWQQKNYDQNDCDESSPHYNTPQVIDMDVLGKAFQTKDDNGTDGTPEYYITHNQLDITGRPLTINDAKEREMTVNLFALGENSLLKVSNIDSGTRWLLNDVTDKPIRKWDERGHEFVYQYDSLQRPTDTLVNGVCTERLVYGTDATDNSIGQIKESYAQDGISIFEYDFKGNVITQSKQFVQDYQNEIDWDDIVTLINEVFTQQTTYNALNFPVTLTQPDATLLYYAYDKGGLLNVIQRNNTEIHISNIEYNEKQQRLNIYYGNNTKTKYEYNPQNFRLTRILTTRYAGQEILQDLNYTYDAVGNIIQQTDNAQQTFYFNNQVIDPTGTYQYDALYRLTQATGRELTILGMPSHEDFPDNIPCPNPAANAMQNYTQQYQYDELGNILQMGSVSNWTRDYIYDTSTNRLLKHNSQQSTDDYTYDAHGNMLTMPHLSSMEWDEKDQLHSASNGTFTGYYNYDAQGNRTRKVIDKGNIIETRYYIGEYEVFRKENSTADFERTTLNITDDEKTFVRIETKTGESPVIRYQYDNHLGSACLELDETGDIISYEEYHPFGTTSYRSGRTEIEVSLKRYKYCGKERDEETGLYYYGMRYYAAWLCRFVSVDPLQFKYPYYTPYQYAGNKPVSFIDLDGREEMPNPYDMLARELKALWDVTIGSLFPSKEEKKVPEKKNETPQKIKPAEKELPKNSNNSQRAKELEQLNTTITTPDNIKFVGNAKAEHVSEYTISILSNAAVKANIDVISVTSTKRSAESQINAMYANVERTGVAYQLNEYGNKGDAVFLAYQEAKNAGASETEIKLAMLGKAEEVGFISTHMSSNYDKLNAVDVPYRNMTSKQEEAFKNTIKEQNNNIVIRKENNVLHLEIPQSEKK